jgi:hypothetical protein
VGPEKIKRRNAARAVENKPIPAANGASNIEHIEMQ